MLSVECEKCTPLQTSFLEDLRKQLEVFKGLGCVGEPLVEDAVDKYIHKFIQAGSTDSVDHLHEHLEQLFKREKLISDNDLHKAKHLSFDVSSLKRSSFTDVVESSSTTLVKETLATPFSKCLFYHSSICSLAVNKCTVGNFQEFFKAQKFQSLREVSLSQSSHECYLIAMDSDSTYYIAFQSEPDITLTGWARKYKSFSEGSIKCPMP